MAKMGYNVDVVSEMEKILSEELSKNIDKQILSELFSEENKRKMLRKARKNKLNELFTDDELI